MSPALPVNVTCPACRTPFTAQVYNIIDTKRDPEAKQAFLQGRANIITCPKCGQSGMLATPLVYHDADKELLLVFVPDHVQIKADERERMIGKLINGLISTIPQEQRRAYLLQPQTFLSFDRLMERVLEAEGITKAMIESQRAAVQLIENLLDVKDDAEALKKLAEEHKEALDYEFFMLLSASADATAQEGDSETASKLADLRDKLLDLVEPPMPETLPQGAGRGELLERLLEAENDDQKEALIAANRPMLDYLFFQEMTSRMETAQQAGDQAQASKLENLRSQLLELLDELDKEMREMQEQSIALIQKLAASEDLDKELPEHIAEYDTLFFALLGGMINSAEKSGKKEVANRLTNLRDRAIKLLEEQLPPEIKLLNRLMDAEYPEGTRQILLEAGAILRPELVEAMRSLADDLEKQKQPATANKLRDIANQAAMLTKA